MGGTNPDHVSTLKVTDPELIEVFDNFAFDEVLRHSGLDTRTRLMVQLAALIGCQALQRVPGHARRRPHRRGYAGRGQGDRLPGRPLRRDGQGVRLHPRHQRRPQSERGVQLPLDGQATTTPATRAEKGRAVQEQIAGADRTEAHVRVGGR